MTIETDLRELLTFHPEFAENKTLNKVKALRLDREFEALLIKHLLIEGSDPQKVKNNYDKLIPYFDKKNPFFLQAEVPWLECNLPPESNTAICLHMLFVNYRKLVAPEEFREIELADISTPQELNKWLLIKKSQAKTKRERYLYKSLLSLLHEITKYLDDVGKINSTGIQALLSFLPIAFIILGTAVCAEELFAVYAVYLLLLKGGQYVGDSIKELQAVGKTIHKAGSESMTLTNILLVRLTEMVFWASHRSYSGTMQAGSSLLKSFATSRPKSITDSAQLELVAAIQSDKQGLNFIKIIAAPIKAQRDLLKQQYFFSMRSGKTKDKALGKLLLELDKVDTASISLADKLHRADKLLAEVKENTFVYEPGKETALAIDQAEYFLQILKSHSLNAEEQIDLAQSVSSSQLLEQAEFCVM